MEYRETAEQISQAANDNRNLLAAVNFPDTRGYKSVINNLFLRAVGIVVLIFVLAVFYRMIGVRFKNKSVKKNRLIRTPFTNKIVST